MTYDPAMRIVVRIFGCAAVSSVCASALAADAPSDGTTFTLSRETSASAPAARARSLAAQGKCSDALDAFDEALRHTTDATLYRDRGKCHDQLDHRFPAIDDYRAYLTAMPAAKDADAIRTRLDELEAQVPPEQRKLGQGGDFEVEMRGGVGAYDRSERTAKQQQEDDTAKAANDNRPLREIEDTEKRDREAKASPLRDGKGPILGFFVMPRYWTSDTFRVSQSYGVALRYSLGAVSTIISEIAYVNASSGGTVSQLGGIGVFIGYEARVSLDHWSSNHLLFGGGIEYENDKQGVTGFVYSTFIPRARIGWRHTFSKAIGLEVTGDGGVGLTHALGSTQADFVSGVFGGNVALLVGF